MNSEANVRLFISCVSAEFRDYRDQLRRDLTRHNVEVKVQEDFVSFGTPTLDMLDRYIANCHAVIHLVGDMTGAFAAAESVSAMRASHPDLTERLPPLGAVFAADEPLSYTQWEAWLTLYHGRRLFIAQADEQAPRDGRTGYATTEESRSRQAAHLSRLAECERFPTAAFRSPDQLSKQILRTAILDLLAGARLPAARPNTLPHAPLGSLFKGRKAVMAELERVMQGSPAEGTAAVVVALQGLGGVGKTCLAVEYAHRHADAYTALLFVSAESPQQLEAGLARMVAPQVLDLAEQEERESAVRAAAVLAWLRTNPGWMIILDNVDTEAAANAAEDLLAKLSGGHVLITGRLANFSAGIQTVELDVLSADEGIGFLLERTRGRRRAASDDDERAGEIARELGFLALALEQAGAFIARHRIGFARYLQLWREARGEVLGWSDARVMRYPRSVAVTWATSVSQLSAESARLLERLSWLAPEAIPRSLLDVVPGMEEADTATASLEALEAWVGLLDYSFAVPSAPVENSSTQGTDIEDSFVIHRLVQEVTRRRQDPAQPTALVEALAWLEAAFVGDPWDARAWLRLDPLAPHVGAALDFASGLNLDVVEIAVLARRLAHFYSAKGSHQQAVPLLRLAVATSERHHGSTHPEVATALNQLASLLRHLDRPSDAEPLFRRALAIRVESLGPDHPQVATSLNGLARLLCDTNRHSKAEPLLRQALAIREGHHGPDHPLVATVLIDLGALLRHVNRGGEAEPLFRRALGIREDSYGLNHPHVAGCLNEMAWLLQDAGRLEEAEHLVRRALEILEARSGSNHPHVAVSLNSLAQILQDTGRGDEAEAMLRRALAIREATYGPKHSHVAVSLNNLAFLIASQGRTDEAETVARRALAILEERFGGDHPQVAASLNVLGGVLDVAGCRDEAERAFRRALLIHEAALGPDHPLVARNLDNLAQVLATSGRRGEAADLLHRASGICQASLAGSHPWAERIRLRQQALTSTTISEVHAHRA